MFEERPKSFLIRREVVHLIRTDGGLRTERVSIQTAQRIDAGLNLLSFAFVTTIQPGIEKDLKHLMCTLIVGRIEKSLHGFRFQIGFARLVIDDAQSSVHLVHTVDEAFQMNLPTIAKLYEVTHLQFGIDIVERRKLRIAIECFLHIFINQLADEIIVTDHLVRLIVHEIFIGKRLTEYIGQHGLVLPDPINVLFRNPFSFEWFV